jgi:catechol 2,3-dioxygenase-like lactoylglutathione lyase family enzyme
MPIKFQNVGIAVRDIEETIAFFTDLGLTVLGRDTVRGEWADTEPLPTCEGAGQRLCGVACGPGVDVPALRPSWTAWWGRW